jgi:hypothetical protein
LDQVESMGKAFGEQAAEAQAKAIEAQDKQSAYVAGILEQLGLAAVWLLLTILALFGAIRMAGLKSYGLAVTSAVITLIPCITPCCLLGQIAGIWALIVLMNADVKSLFR